MISIQGLKVEFGSQVLFAGVSYVINKRDKIALVGKNGAGKTTMLKIIAGEQQPTDGTVDLSSLRPGVYAVQIDTHEAQTTGSTLVRIE